MGFGDKPGVVGHEKAGEYITEEFTPLADGSGAFLIFKDNTHKIRLIKKIKTQHTLIRALIIQKNSGEHTEIGRKIIEHGHVVSGSKQLSQDLVDELLAEYGL